MDGGVDVSVDAGISDIAMDAMPDTAPSLDAGMPGVEVWYFGGIYFVPEQTDVSTYPVFESTWTRNGDRVGLFYNLPRMLTGDSTRVAMTGTAAGTTATLSGPLGTATCELDATGLPISCLEEFVGITVDLDRVRREAERDDPGRVAERIAVAEQFENEPIGVIEAQEGLYGPAEQAACVSDADCPASTCDLEDDGQSYCTPVSPERALGEACALDFECAAGLKCDHEARLCETDD